MSDKVKISELFDSVPQLLCDLFKDKEYPWEILPCIKGYIRQLTEDGLKGYTELMPQVYVGKNVQIADNVTIIPPAIIGDDTELRPGAYLRGNVIIGKGCVIGNSTEVKNAILFDNVAAPHYNYIGDSIVGNHAHLGAGVILSNLKSDKTNITIKGEKTYPTYLRKMSAIVGDNAEIGCGCVLNPGTIVGKNTNIYPLTSVRGVIPKCSIAKSNEVIVKKQ